MCRDAAPGARQHPATHQQHAEAHQPPSRKQQEQEQQQQQEHERHLADLVARNFPPIIFGFAYGSGVFAQPDLYHPSTPPGAGPMLDFIFVVDDPLRWHDQNVQWNPHHYSFLKLLGPSVMCRVAERVGVGVYFNTLVPLEGQVVKYGVVGAPAFLQDLHHWSHLYVGGRLHKPVALLAAQPATQAAYEHNLRSALSTALLLLPQPSASLRDLYKRITALSYQGDVRMGLAEDSRKVERIVAGSYHHFRQLYGPLLQDPAYRDLGIVADEGGVSQLGRRDTSLELLTRLPSVLLARMAAKLAGLPHQAAAAAAAVTAGAASGVGAQLPALPGPVRRDIAQAALASANHRRLIKAGLRSIVAGSSRRQALAGVLYAGPVKSLVYLGRKLAKAWRL